MGGLQIMRLSDFEALVNVACSGRDMSLKLADRLVSGLDRLIFLLMACKFVLLFVYVCYP
jgi:hypothetical protein